jgi:hypothetical protein
LASPPNSKSGQTPPLAYPHARTNLRNETACGRRAEHIDQLSCSAPSDKENRCHPKQARGLHGWLPAKSAIHTSFLMFYAHTPADFGKVVNGRFENGTISIEDTARHRITLRAYNSRMTV